MRPNSITAGIHYLVRTQDRAGYWTDFWLKRGASDAWVTAYTGMLLWEVAQTLAPPLARQACAAVVRAADWLTTQIGPSEGWGYNSSVTADADSTAWAIMLLAALERGVPTMALTFLQQHQGDDGLFRTYRFRSGHAWSQTALDVSLTGASALLRAGVWSPAEGRSYWEHVIAPRQNLDGTFSGYWWAHPHFPTWLARRLWRQLDQPALPYAWPSLTGDAPFLLACAGREIASLGAAQLCDGSWKAVPILQVPPSHEDVFNRRPHLTHDARRIFTTVTVLRSLTEYPAPPPSRRSAPRRASYGRRCDDQVQTVSAALGFDDAQQQEAVSLFQTLTQHALASPNAWPAAQLSSLSMGQPLEFSAECAAATPTADEAVLRYTCEIGDPVLPPFKRAQSGLNALAAAAQRAGCGALWQEMGAVWREVGRCDDSFASDPRFWVWGGVSHPANGLPTVKVYASTLHTETGQGSERLRAILAAAGMPYQGEFKWVCERLAEVGFPQEIGFGLRGDGKWGAKIYYEFHGWRPAMIAEIAQTLCFPTVTSQLTPAIPGILSESFAKRRRSGLSFRMHPRTGDVLELTTTAAFPQQLIPLGETHARMKTWLQDDADGHASGERDSAAFDRCFAALRPITHDYWRLFSLFTQTVTRDGKAKTTIYLRPRLEPT